MNAFEHLHYPGCALFKNIVLHIFICNWRTPLFSTSPNNSSRQKSTKVNLEPGQTSEVELFVRIVNSWKPFYFEYAFGCIVSGFVDQCDRDSI